MQLHVKSTTSSDTVWPERLAEELPPSCLTRVVLRRFRSRPVSSSCGRFMSYPRYSRTWNRPWEPLFVVRFHCRILLSSPRPRENHLSERRHVSCYLLLVLVVLFRWREACLQDMVSAVVKFRSSTVLAYGTILEDKSNDESVPYGRYTAWYLLNFFS